MYIYYDKIISDTRLLVFYGKSLGLSWELSWFFVLLIMVQWYWSTVVRVMTWCLVAIALTNIDITSSMYKGINYRHEWNSLLRKMISNWTPFMVSSTLWYMYHVITVVYSHIYFYLVPSLILSQHGCFIYDLFFWLCTYVFCMFPSIYFTFKLNGILRMIKYIIQQYLKWNNWIRSKLQ